MKNKKIFQINIGILIVYAILLILSMTQNFINMTDGTINISLSQVSGFPFVFIGFLLSIILLIKKNRYVLASFIFSTIGYIYSFYSIHNILSRIDEGLNAYITYGFGYYLYIISFLLLMMNMIVYILITVDEQLKKY